MSLPESGGTELYIAGYKGMSCQSRVYIMSETIAQGPSA